MSFRITSFEEYQSEYTKSIENPEQFWTDKPNIFHGVKNGIKFWRGISLSQM